MKGNPILQAMRANPMNQVNEIMNMANWDANAAVEMLKKRNPQFKKFWDENHDKPVDQIAKENGINMNTRI